jgi:hypothetical protein
MNRAIELETMIQANGGKVYLWQILDRRDGLSCKYTQAVSELRDRLERKRLTVNCYKDLKNPSKNVYKIEPLAEAQGELFREAV